MHAPLTIVHGGNPLFLFWLVFCMFPVASVAYWAHNCTWFCSVSGLCGRSPLPEREEGVARSAAGAHTRNYATRCMLFACFCCRAFTIVCYLHRTPRCAARLPHGVGHFFYSGHAGASQPAIWAMDSPDDVGLVEMNVG